MQENTELYYRALKAIRSAPPPMPVDIRRALGLEIKEEIVEENEAEALMNFARRYVAPKQQPLRAGKGSGLRVAATLVCQKAVLSEPPPPLQVDRAQKLWRGGVRMFVRYFLGIFMRFPCISLQKKHERAVKWLQSRLRALRQEQREARERDCMYDISHENAFKSTQKFSALKDLLGGM